MAVLKIRMRFWKPKQFPRRPLLSVVVSACFAEGLDVVRRSAALTCLLHSFRAQSYPNWEALVVHDGNDGSSRAVAAVNQARDDRINLWVTPERKGHCGHPWRHVGALKTRGDVVGMTNDDNYYAPVYFEAIADQFVNHGADFVYTDMVHSHRRWQPVGTRLQRKLIDVGAWMAARALVVSTPWTDFEFAGDWTYIDALQKKAKTIAKVPGCLFVHN